MTTALRPAARHVELVVQAGDDRPVVIPVLGRDGEPRDVTGWTARAVVRAHRRATEVLHTWSSAAHSAECDRAGVTLLVDDSDTWTWSRGEFDLVLTDQAGARVIEAYGPVWVRGLITR